MIRALIVDDERMIRNGMQRALPWQTLGVGEVYAARSGSEALDMIREHRPELLITDIRMDGMTGLELIDQAHLLVPDLRVIVLTGYDDFEYARQCIKLKVHDFFLKPIDEHALMNAVRNQVAAIAQGRRTTFSEVNEHRARALTEQMQIECFLRRAVSVRGRSGVDEHGSRGRFGEDRTGPRMRHADELPGGCNPITEEEVRRFCEAYGYDPHQPAQAAIIVPELHTVTEAAEDGFDVLTIRNICFGLVDARNRGLTFTDDAGRVVIIFFPHRRGSGILDWVREINGILSDECGRKRRIVLGNAAERLFEVSASYREALSLLEIEDSSCGGVVQTRVADRRDRLFKEVFAEMKHAMACSMTDRERVMSIFERFCQATEAYGLSDGYVRQCCFELISCISFEFLCHSGRETEISLDMLSRSLANAGGDEVCDLSRRFLSGMLGGQAMQSQNDIVDRVKQYIGEHLTEELSVILIANTLYITPNYLSRLFKKETGEGCYEYIVRKRIEKAKFLLETTNLPTSRVGHMVGYRDTNYFSMAMKKNTGMSPTRYREAHRQGAEPGEPGAEPEGLTGEV